MQISHFFFEIWNHQVPRTRSYILRVLIIFFKSIFKFECVKDGSCFIFLLLVLDVVLALEEVLSAQLLGDGVRVHLTESEFLVGQLEVVVDETILGRVGVAGRVLVVVLTLTPARNHPGRFQPSHDVARIEFGEFRG